MVNKKGWLRIVEASIAILIILSVLLVVAEKKNVFGGDDLSTRITPLLEEIALNATMREQILNSDNNLAEVPLRDFVSKRITDSGIGFDVSVCGYKEICRLEKYPEDAKGDVFSGERVISSALGSSQLNPKKVVIFLWFKK